jgi:hypothetical protein
MSQKKMQVELFHNKNKYWELWADNKFVVSIDRVKGSTDEQYKQKAQRELDDYISKAQSLKKGGSTEKIVEI